MKHKNGFTLVEVLIAFSILILLTSFLPQAIKVIRFEPKLLHHMETSLFFQQLTLDVQLSSTIQVANNILYLQQNNEEEVTYAYFQNRVRRQVNHKGQEIVLQNISTIKFTKWKNGIDVLITDIYNQTHQNRITHRLPLETMKDG
ncbi:hypothetical protein DS745_14790 [Anaerobacillus alkaliphilus]|uniref:Prepilin-type N-terminal cleavage/methylation domain-containing protein n=1 Tax=Anaerobacillus alkaliphilus TaxID=1548597 RepID=A0A4V1LG94_9BACI|nr:competence type IV pilus minor pilin ComGF [Anaerobacillus alkaliphilus]RXI99588.1 hypothetical protein DS745_14790 [Anaerobacillus alkaliphilus]